MEIIHKPDNQWETKTVAKSVIEDGGVMSQDELHAKLDEVLSTASKRVAAQLDNTIRIKALEDRNKRLQVEEKS